MNNHIDEYISTLQSMIKRNSNLISKLTEHNKELLITEYEHIGLLVDDIVRLEYGTFSSVQEEINWYKKKAYKRKKELKELADNQRVLKKLYQDLLLERMFIDEEKS